jgi:surface antigen
MRTELPLMPLATSVVTGFVLVATLMISPEFALADGNAAGGGAGSSSCTCPENKARQSTRPKYADLKSGFGAEVLPSLPARGEDVAQLSRPALDEADEIAALESIQYALSEVGDRSSYVWHRRNGRLSGVIQPTSSFKDAAGNVCRHVVVTLVSGSYSRRAEGVACRTARGRWQLDG